jgi:protein-L-isoaspartate(D-aspartate) O-methyltransferase
MDFNIARSNMAQQQLRPWGVLDPQLLEIFSTIPREQFVPDNFKQLACSEAFLPIGNNQVMLPPNIIARMLQPLQLRKDNKVLQIGTGTGYITALLCQLAKTVTAIEIIPALAKQTTQNLKYLNLYNVSVQVGDGTQGSLTKDPSYDAIVLTGSLPFLPKILGEKLATHGKLFAVLGKPPSMSALLLTRTDKQRWEETILFETELPPLFYAHKQTGFQF